jgi:hypothetical protein
VTSLPPGIVATKREKQAMNRFICNLLSSNHL